MSRDSDFWSRRKAKVEAEAEAEARKVEEDQVRATQAELEEKTDAEVLEELGLPDPDHLEPGQDIAEFMNKAVPERLRQRALRQLWRLNPALANLDGLCDYNDDFTNAATDAPGVVTAYRVGKGLLKHIEALEKEAADAEMVAESTDQIIPENSSGLAETCTNSENTPESDSFSEIAQENADAATASTTIVLDVAEYDDSTPLDTVAQEPMRPRRMRFRIESETG